MDLLTFRVNKQAASDSHVEEYTLFCESTTYDDYILAIPTENVSVLSSVRTRSLNVLSDLVILEIPRTYISTRQHTPQPSSRAACLQTDWGGKVKSTDFLKWHTKHKTNLYPTVPKPQDSEEGGWFRPFGQPVYSHTYPNGKLVDRAAMTGILGYTTTI